MYQLNPDVTKSGNAPVPEVAAWAAIYRQSNADRPLIDMAPGTPSQPCQELLERIKEGVDSNENARYGPGAGSLILREALMRDLNSTYNADDVTANDIVITLGANQAFYVCLGALARSGDEVIIQIPFFFNTHMALQQLGITPVFLPCLPENNFLPLLESLESLFTPKTRALVLVSPNNPAGVTIPSKTLIEFAKICARHKIPLILDETYRDLLPSDWEGHEIHGKRARPHSLFTKDAENELGLGWRDYLIQLYSFSKGYAIPGYRLGSIVASSTILNEILKIIDTQTICPAGVAQAAIAWAIPNTVQWREDVRAQVNQKIEVFRQSVQSRLAEKGWRVGSSGAYYVLLQHPFDAPSKEVVKAMISQCGVSVLPLSYFMDLKESPIEDNWLRCSVPGVSSEQIEEAVSRLQALQV